jgi:hypothetical protein
MSALHTRSTVGQQSKSPVLSASSPASLPSGGETWLHQDHIAINRRPFKSKSRLPIWVYYPPPPCLERNLYNDKFAQFLKIQHTPPVANVPIERPSGISRGGGGDDDDDEDSDDDSEDDDEDSKDSPPSADPNYQPVPTKWLMLGYSRVADIPTSLPTATMTRGCQRPTWYSSCARDLPVSSTKNMIAPCKAVGDQTDWMQAPQAQALGVITLFLIAIFLIHSILYLARACFRGRAKRVPSGRLALQGDEKQLRALAEDTESRIETPSIDLKPPV